MSEPVKTFRPKTPAELRVLPYEAAHAGGIIEAHWFAARSLFWLGALCMIFGFGAAAAYFFLLISGGFLTSFSVAWISVVSATLLASAMLLGVLGILYWVCGWKLRRGSLAAAYLAMALTALSQGIMLLPALPGLILLFHGEFLAAFVFFGITLLFTVGLVDLMLHLFEFIRWRRRL